MKIPFYILGLLLRYGPQHGYRLKQIIDDTISDFAKIKLPTIYYHLDKLKNQGYITETPDKYGNRPEKMVYSITDKGTKYFDDLLAKQLKESYSPEFPIDGVLYFIEKTDRNNLLKELIYKKTELSNKIEALEKHKENALNNMPQIGRPSAEIIFQHHILHLKAELEWLEITIKGL